MMGQRAGFMLSGFFVLSGCHGVSVMSKTEQASYRVVESHGNIELRDYPAMNLCGLGLGCRAFDRPARWL
jgi:hypothetical protein